MKITNNFTLKEMTHTGLKEHQKANFDASTQYLHNILSTCKELQKLRDYIARAVMILSGFRYPGLNTAVGGSPTSDHMTGRAADFTVEDFTDTQGLLCLFLWCRDNLDYGQLIFYAPKDRPPWIHLGLPREGRKKDAWIIRDGQREEI